MYEAAFFLDFNERTVAKKACGKSRTNTMRNMNRNVCHIMWEIENYNCEKLDLFGKLPMNSVYITYFIAVMGFVRLLSTLWTELNHLKLFLNSIIVHCHIRKH